MRCSAVLYLVGAMLYTSCSFAVDVPREKFPIEDYAQTVSNYISPNDPNYTKNLLTPEAQAARLKLFYRHYYDSSSNGLSPWSEAMVNAVLPHIKQVETGVLNEFREPNHYAENFRVHTKTWWPKLQENSNLNTLDTAVFQAENRAIVVSNTMARALPDAAPDFLDAKIPGEGFPFDNLQVSSLWVGTPLYVMSTSKDKAWSLVLTPDAYFAWVKSSDIAYTSPEFILHWQKAAEKQLGAITKTAASVLSTAGHFQFSTYIGAVFPLISDTGADASILIPVKNMQQQARVKRAVISHDAITKMPFAATPEHMAGLIKALQDRPYGWGGAFFLNDCSQEMKSLFTPFGIWLPRNSGMQQAFNQTTDLSSSTPDARLSIVKSDAHPLMTLIYVKGHILLYVGNAEVNHETVPMSYQNVWGNFTTDNKTRYVIGGSVFLPLLKQYPQNSAIYGQINKPKLKLVHLDKPAVDEGSPQAFAEQFI